MRRRPWILVILALLHILAPIGNQIMNAYWAHMPVLRYIQMALKPHNLSRHWIHFVAPIVAGIAIYACKRWSFIVYFIAMYFLFIASYHGYIERSLTIDATSLLVVYVINISVVAYFLIPAVRSIYFDPRLRWWETSPRYKADFVCQFLDEKNPFQGQIANFSIGGIFLKSAHIPQDGATIETHFSYEGVNYVFQGQVIRHNSQNAIGFGVKFIPTPLSQKSAKSLAKILRDKGHELTGRTLTQEDSFMYWLTSLVKTGRGIVPEVKKKS